MKRRAPGCLFFLMGSIFPILGGTVAETQRRKFAEGIEVPAEVIGHDVTIHDDGEGGLIYGPVLTLRYLADGMPPTGQGLLALDIASSDVWAQEQLAAWPVGKRVTAWADPNDLERSYVVRVVSPLPYVIMLFPMIFVSFGFMFMLFPPGEDRVYRPGTPWAWRSFLFAWNAVGVAAAGHYFSQPGAWNAGGIALFGTYLGIGVLPVLLQAWRWVRSPR
ncbi:MAG: hypothetical protein HUU15_10625 [Candidatus Brocadiae bacterium]|nr:hypothetical protein [Candidatus Brocadiia bacterium]